LQVPNSFTVLGAESSLSLVSIINPLVSGPAPEPGHYLVRFSGFSSLPNGSLQVFVRAPSAPSGPFAFKVVLTGSGLAVSDPPNFTSFASLTAANFVKTASVVAAPTPLFVLDIEGLVASGALSGRGITLGDLDDDGNDDLAATTTSGTARPGIHACMSRAGAPWIERSTGLGSSDSRLANGDFDGDGNRDIAVGDGTIYFGDGHGNWTPGPTLPLLAAMGEVAVADVDNDGR